MVQTRFQARASGNYILDIPSRGVFTLTYEEILHDSKKLVSFLTSLDLPFDAPGMLEMFQFLHDRPYVLFKFPSLREAVNQIIWALRPIFRDRYDEDGFLQKHVLTEGAPTSEIMDQCQQIETLMNEVESL
jgi:hypothetical protein